MEKQRKRHEHLVSAVEEGSIAWEMGIEPGDRLLLINGQEIEDVFDYHYYVNDENLLVLIEKPDGEQWELEIEKEYEEDLGLTFEQGLMSTGPAETSAFSVLLIRCQRGCVKHCISKMTIQDCLFCREIM